MTRYLLDTSVLIDYSKRREPSLSRVNAMLASGDELCTCAVVLGEFFTGVPPSVRPVWEAFLAVFTYLDTPREAAIRAGADRWAFARLGQPLGLPDVLIVATARSAGAVVVTTDVPGFPMSDVPLISPGD